MAAITSHRDLYSTNVADKRDYRGGLGQDKCEHPTRGRVCVCGWKNFYRRFWDLKYAIPVAIATWSKRLAIGAQQLLEGY